ncbi:hypothetical protein NORO109296_19680 [Nocardiopsis rhodophaea]
MWKLNTTKIDREQFALIVAEGYVHAVAKIAGHTAHGDRIAREGDVLSESHPVRDAYLGRPDPVESTSRNPVGYVDLPGDTPPSTSTPATAAATG